VATTRPPANHTAQKQQGRKEVAVKRTTHSALFKLFFLVLTIDAVLFLILAGFVLNALVNQQGFTPALITWVAAYVSFMLVFSTIMFALVIVTVTIRMKDAQLYKQVLRRRREMELKRQRQRFK
jgi:hypothetical protein